jgi:hypothetical protein
MQMIRSSVPLLLFSAFITSTSFTSTSFAQAVESTTPASPPSVFENPAIVQRYQATITPEDLASQLYLLSSDFFEGRETTSRGQKLAAHYLASQYRKLGLQPKGTVRVSNPYSPEAYFQPFTVYGQKLQGASLSVKVQGDLVATSSFSSQHQDDHSYFLFGTRPNVEGSVVFAGYGISDVDLEYDDFVALEDRDISIAGKWLLILRDEPLKDDTTSLLPTTDGAPSVWSKSVYQKLRAAYRHAVPKGFLIVGDVGPRGARSIGDAAERAAAGLESVGSLSLMETGTTRPPAYMISSDLANDILSPSGRTVDEIKDLIDENLSPVVFELPGVIVSSQLKFESFAATTENVLAYIEGTDPTVKHEVVVISSHYDHIGIDLSRDGDQINNGADDDASGTVTTLEIAEAFMKAKRDGLGPRRSILFLNVSGEEKGLLGSEYYADVEPVFPLQNTVTNLNIDMIGRYDPTYEGDHPENYVYVIGSKLISEELHDINLRTNEETGIGLELNERFNSRNDPNQFYARSDHWNFGKHGIPFIFFFTGTHDDYHRPGDEADKIDYERLSRIGQLIFATAWQVANQDQPPVVSGSGFH